MAVTHIDKKISDAHAILSEPPFRYGSKIGEQQYFIQPNMAYAITAEAGCELQEYLERHFLHVSNALNRMHRLSISK
jgi:predicted transcriptional regulator